MSAKDTSSQIIETNLNGIQKLRNHEKKNHKNLNGLHHFFFLCGAKSGMRGQKIGNVSTHIRNLDDKIPVCHEAYLHEAGKLTSKVPCLVSRLM